LPGGGKIAAGEGHGHGVGVFLQAAGAQGEIEQQGVGQQPQPGRGTGPGGQQHRRQHGEAPGEQAKNAQGGAGGHGRRWAQGLFQQIGQFAEAHQGVAPARLTQEAVEGDAKEGGKGQGEPAGHGIIRGFHQTTRMTGPNGARLRATAPAVLPRLGAKERILND